MIKISLVLCMVALTVGCAASQITPVLAAPALTKASTPTTPAKQEIIKKGVIAIEIRRSDLWLVYEETFDQPTTVVHGACPRRISLPDGSMMPKMDECLVWPIDEIGSTFATGLRNDWIVTYRFAYTTSVQAGN